MPAATTADIQRLNDRLDLLEGRLTTLVTGIGDSIMALSPELAGLDTSAQKMLQIVTDLQAKITAGGSLSIEDKAVLLVVKNAFDVVIKAQSPVV